MIVFNISETKGGYFLGDFEPSILKSSDVSIAVKRIFRGALDGGYYRKCDTEIVYIMSGVLEIDKKKYKKGDIILWEPQDVINIFAIEDSEYLLIKLPGSRNDIYHDCTENLSYEELDERYSYYMNAICSMEKTELYSAGKSIASGEISVVVQGYADRKYTEKTLLSIRKYLPDAEIILSTWKDCERECDRLSYDDLVLNEDPGNCNCSRWQNHPIQNNGNRQILSTVNGLTKADRKYTLKLRSDLLLLGDDIIKYVNCFQGKKGRYAMFEDRLMIGELFTRSHFEYERGGKWYKVPKPFHPSDWFIFGKTEDVKKLYRSVSLIPNKEMCDYKCRFPERVMENDYPYTWRYATEQHIFYSLVKKEYPDMKFDDWTDWSDGILEISNEVLMDNFVVLNFTQHKILNQKYPHLCFANSGVSYDERSLLTSKDCMKYYEASMKKQIELETDIMYFVCQFGIGDTMMVCGLKDAIEETYHCRLKFVIKPSHEYIMEAYGYRDYIVYGFSRDELLELGRLCPAPEKGKLWAAHPEFCGKVEIINEFMKDKINFMEMYKFFLDIPQESSFLFPQIKPEISRKTANALTTIDLQRTVVVAPELGATDPADQIKYDFFKGLVNELEKEGYFVIVNAINPGSKKIGGIQLELDLKDLVGICLKCNRVISARSGLCDLLFYHIGKMNVIYPNRHFYKMYGFGRTYGMEREGIREIVYERDEKDGYDYHTYL